jgi:RHS repeat-associated protein
VTNDGTFTSSTAFDALNRPLSVTSPDGSVYRPAYNAANLLDRVEVDLRGGGLSTAFVSSIDYNAKGQRESVEYGNGASTAYEYDPHTFRLSRAVTTRHTEPGIAGSWLYKDPAVIQDLRYWYDPVGNVVRIEDVAHKTVFYAGQVVEPVASYTYDAVYRHIEAKGREHIGQNAFDFSPPNSDHSGYPFVGNRAHPNDLRALRNYTQRYVYDPVGNFQALAHRFNGAGWTRRYEYQASSLLEVGVKNNRLTRTTVGNGINRSEAYEHDAHGNITSMPHVAGMIWDYKDRLVQSDLGGGGTAYYVYDNAGLRVRKVIESQSGARQHERLYLGGFEIYREHDGAGIVRERESLHVFDADQRVALVETQTVQNGNVLIVPVSLSRYQVLDHVGSSSLELDHRGAVISYEEFHSYGTTSFTAVFSVAEVGQKRYRYSGKEREEETGLCYYGQRYYCSWLCRWISCDPAGLVDGANLYVFAANSPLVYIDVNGMYCDPAVQSCPDVVGPTQRELSLQQSLADGRHVPPTVSRYQSPVSASSIRQGARGQQGQSETQVGLQDELHATSSTQPGPTPEEEGILEVAGDYLRHSETAQFAVGLVMGGLAGATPGGFVAGIGAEATGVSGDLPRALRMGYGLGEAAWGAAQIVAGIGGGLGGGTLVLGGAGATATGVGAPVGVGAIAGGSGLIAISGTAIAEGAVDVGAGLGIFMSSMSSGSGGSGGGGGGSTQGAPGGGAIPPVGKAVNSNLPHAAQRAAERQVFGSVDEAATALRALTSQINQAGAFPAGTLRDTARAGRYLVPTGSNGLAVYQLAPNGTAKLKTVLIAR